jgi:hypothetical protein
MSSPPRDRWASRSGTKISIRGFFNALRLAILPALVLAGFALHVWYWQQIDLNGRNLTCTVDRKDERIDRRTRSDSWTPTYHVSLSCPYTEAGAPMFPAFDTDAQEFDQIQRGTPFEVRYLRSVPLPLMLVGISSSHLARETLDVHLARLLAGFGPVVAIAGYLLTLSFLGYLMSKRKVPGLRWAFFGLLAPGVLWMLTPTLPVTLSGKTAPATATVTELHQFTRMLDSSRSQGIQAVTPYELVVLQYVPQGRREPVLAADMIDTGSRSHLTVGQQVQVDYEVDHPRRANIQGARRLYYWENVEGALVEAALTMGFLIGGTLLWEFLKRRGKQAMVDARERARDRAL